MDISKKMEGRLFHLKTTPKSQGLVKLTLMYIFFNNVTSRNDNFEKKRRYVKFANISSIFINLKYY